MVPASTSPWAPRPAERFLFLGGSSRGRAPAPPSLHAPIHKEQQHARARPWEAGHCASYLVPELITAGHEVTGLARSDTSAAALSALDAKARRGDLQDLEGLNDAAADPDGVIHVPHRQDLLPSGGMAAPADSGTSMSEP